ncbi:MAG TPA: hypothetical protein V6C95_17010, partial [Coleofasciculaceae cyanobacterium]
ESKDNLFIQNVRLSAALQQEFDEAEPSKLTRGTISSYLRVMLACHQQAIAYRSSAADPSPTCIIPSPPCSFLLFLAQLVKS